MWITNITANFIGVTIVLYLFHGSMFPATEEMSRVGERVNNFFTPGTFILGLVLILLYERPIRRFLNLCRHLGKQPHDAEQQQRQHQNHGITPFLTHKNLLDPGGAWALQEPGTPSAPLS